MVDDFAGKAPDHLLARLEALNSRLDVEMRRRLAASGVRLRGSEGRILNLVAPEGSRPTELAEGAWVSKQAIGRRIHALAERGLVRLEPDPRDGRAVLVLLTPAGTRARAVVLEQIAQMERQFASEIGRARYQEFRRLLRELAAGG